MMNEKYYEVKDNIQSIILKTAKGFSYLGVCEKFLDSEKLRQLRNIKSKLAEAANQLYEDYNKPWGKHTDKEIDILVISCKASDMFNYFQDHYDYISEIMLKQHNFERYSIIHNIAVIIDANLCGNVAKEYLKEDMYCTRYKPNIDMSIGEYGGDLTTGYKFHFPETSIYLTNKKIKKH